MKKNDRTRRKALEAQLDRLAEFCETEPDCWDCPIESECKKVQKALEMCGIRKSDLGSVLTRYKNKIIGIVLNGGEMKINKTILKKMKRECDKNFYCAGCAIQNECDYVEKILGDKFTTPAYMSDETIENIIETIKQQPRGKNEKNKR